MAFTPIILAHVATAGAALVIGALTFALPKGTPAHKLFGRLWVGLMVATSLISFGIQRSGEFSAIHILSVIALAGVSAAVVAAIRGNVHSHRRGMLAAYICLVVAGAFTLLPNRLLGSLVWNAAGLI